MKPSAKLFLFSLILCFIFTWLLILGTMGSHEKKNFTNKSDKDHTVLEFYTKEKIRKTYICLLLDIYMLYFFGSDLLLYKFTIY